MIALGLRPFKAIEDEGFQEGVTIGHLEINYRIAKASRLTRSDFAILAKQHLMISWPIPLDLGL